jgi:hypothetical protein
LQTSAMGGAPVIAAGIGAVTVAAAAATVGGAVGASYLLF